MGEEKLRSVIQVVLQELPAETPSSAQAELVEMLLRLRKVGRTPLAQPLGGLYQEICDRLRQQLQLELAPALRHCDLAELHGAALQAWASNLLHRASQQILTDDTLKALALEAQRHPSGSALRRHALVQLVEAIRLWGRLARPHRGKFSPQFYNLLYEDAVNRTLAYVCRRIDTYDPQRGKAQKFMNWVNFRLDRMVIECRREASDLDTQSLPNLNDLDALPQPVASESLADTICKYIQSDPEQVFRQTHIRNRPDASFQVIALARFSGQSWEEIATHLKIKIPTLSSFFMRSCDKFSAQFQTLL